MNTDYRILGLTQGASPEEIKKAYFKMVRLHSPESDPQKFQEIRQAYERLKNAKSKSAGPSFPPLSDPLAVKMLKQIQKYRKEKNLTLYRDCCEEAWNRFPKDIHFLYLLIMAQRRCGNTGKAVKNAELLVSKDPDNQWYQMVLAFSYKERGFTQKAFAACKNAYALGCMDTDFLLMYGSACDDNHLYEEGISILMRLVKQDIRWTREDIPKITEAYFGLISMNYYGHADALFDILDSLCRFIRQYSIYVKEFFTRIVQLIANACTKAAYPSKEYDCIDEIFTFVSNYCSEPSELKEIQTARELFDFQRVCADSRIDDILVSYLELFHDFDEEEDEDEDKMMQKFAITDLQLCMIEQREEILAQADILKHSHPREYEKIAAFIPKLENEPKIHFLKERLLKTYQRLQPFFYDGQFYERYPMEKIHATGIQITDESDNEPYIRSTKKIGRNDPCPCGSGKKFKHCCINK